jgi:hypothetical protein
MQTIPNVPDDAKIIRVRGEVVDDVARLTVMFVAADGQPGTADAGRYRLPLRVAFELQERPEAAREILAACERVGG